MPQNRRDVRRSTHNPEVATAGRLRPPGSISAIRRGGAAPRRGPLGGETYRHRGGGRPGGPYGLTGGGCRTPLGRDRAGRYRDVIPARRENCGRVGASPASSRCYGPGRGPTCGSAMGPGVVTAPRRTRLLVSGAAAGAVVTAVLLALLVAALVAGSGGGLATGYGLAAFGAGGFAVGLLVLARAGAVARTDPARGGALCIRCCVWALFAVLAVFIVGGATGYLTGAAAPIWGCIVAGVLLVVLVGLAARQRVVLRIQAAW